MAQTILVQPVLASYCEKNDLLDNLQNLNKKLWSLPVSEICQKNILLEEKKKIKTSHISNVFINEDKTSITLKRVVGVGGNKTVIELSNAKVLFMPNAFLQEKSIGLMENYRHWITIVDKECRISDCLKRCGLLGSELQKIKLFTEKYFKKPVVTYVSDLFKELERKRIYIIDAKNINSSWKSRLFKRKEDARNWKNWEPLLRFLIKDIAKLIFYQFPLALEDDSFNVAIQQTESSTSLIRYYGFDYSGSFDNELHFKAIGEPEEKMDDEKTLNKKIQDAINTAMKLVIIAEFKNKNYILDKFQNKLIKSLYDYSLPRIKEELLKLHGLSTLSACCVML